MSEQTKKLYLAAFILMLVFFGIGKIFEYKTQELKKEMEQADRAKKIEDEKRQSDAIAAWKQDEATNKNTDEKFHASETSSSEYKSVLGRVWIGTALYDKNTHNPFGFIVDADGSSVWIADSYSNQGDNVQLYAKKYSRAYITANFVTK